MRFIIQYLARFRPLHMWGLLVVCSLIMTIPIVAMMSLLLKQNIDPDFILTGVVTCLLVASVILAIVLQFLHDQKKTEEDLRASEEKLRTMFEMSTIGMARNAMDGRYIDVNKALLEMVGYSLEELNQLSYWDLTPQEHAPQEKEQLESLNTFGRYGPYEKEYIHHDGHRIPIRLNGVLITGRDGEKYIWSTVEDISAQLNQMDELRKYHAEIERLAYHDVLTNLPNRLLLSDRLNQVLAQTARMEKLVAVCYLDLDGFKPVNDTFGHEAGDQLLKEIAGRMIDTVRAHDTVARLGGDEFVLLLTNLENVAEYEAILQRVIAEINKPVVLLNGAEVQVTASIGVTIYPFDSEDPEVLLRHADQAMYQAKSLGRNRVCEYS
jgi:diguanylate cyclase (GGDEF)-like protein/PAS domain S-box-containing protein